MQITKRAALQYQISSKCMSKNGMISDWWKGMNGFKMERVEGWSEGLMDDGEIKVGGDWLVLSAGYVAHTVGSTYSSVSLSFHP